MSRRWDDVVGRNVQLAFLVGLAPPAARRHASASRPHCYISMYDNIPVINLSCSIISSVSPAHLELAIVVYQAAYRAFVRLFNLV